MRESAEPSLASRFTAGFARVLPRARKATTEREIVQFLRDRGRANPWHTFDHTSFRRFIYENMPWLYPQLSDEVVAGLMSLVQQKFSWHIETAQNPPLSDEALVHCLHGGGLLDDMALDSVQAMQRLERMDSDRLHLGTRGAFTEYYASAAPVPPVRVPAESELVGAVILAWPIYYPYRWPQHAEFAHHVTSDAWAYILVPNEHWQKAVELFLGERGIPTDRVRFLRVPLDDVWTRDYAPTMVESGPDRAPALVANPYQPNGIPYQKGDCEAALDLGRYLGAPVHRLPLVIEGGNIVTDGQGTFVMSDSVLLRNPDLTRPRLERLLREYLGCERLLLIRALSGEITGHMDMVVKLLDASRVMVAASAPTYKWHREFEAIAELISRTASPTGEAYEVIRVPVGDNSNRSLNNWSYVNSLIVNGKVIVPQFGVETDREALRVYTCALPGHEIVGVDFRDFPVGSVHCQSKEVPATLVGAPV